MSKFTLFPSLPHDLRLAIWTQTIPLLTPPSRFINIYTIAFHDPSEEVEEGISESPNIDRNGNIILFNSPGRRRRCRDLLHQFIPLQLQRPVILHVNTEARRVGLRYYKLGVEHVAVGKWFTWSPKSCEHLEIVERQKRNFYFDSRRDIFYFHAYAAALVSSPYGPGLASGSGEQGQGTNGYKYICTLENTATMWLLNRHVVRTPRYMAIDGEFLVDLVQDRKGLPDFRELEVMWVVVKNPGEFERMIGMERKLGKGEGEGEGGRSEVEFLERDVLDMIVKKCKRGLKPKNKVTVRIVKSSEEVIVEGIDRLDV